MLQSNVLVIKKQFDERCGEVQNGPYTEQQPTDSALTQDTDRSNANKESVANKRKDVVRVSAKKWINPLKSIRRTFVIKGEHCFV